MKILRKIHQYTNLLSIDVALGAVAGMLYFSRLLEIKAGIAEYGLLAMAVWSIYTFDHLIDAKRLKQVASTPRHCFHQRYFRVIALVCVCMVLLGIMIVLSYHNLRYLLLPGLTLGFGMLFWMLVIRTIGEKGAWLKEISTAVFYVLGIGLVPFLVKGPDMISRSVISIAFGYFLVAWMNLLVLSYLDRESDQSDGFGSILNLISSRKLRGLIWWLSLLGVLYYIGLFWFLSSYFHMFTGLLLLIFLLHAMNFLKADQDKESIRKKLEASFLIPFLLLLV